MTPTVTAYVPVAADGAAQVLVPLLVPVPLTMPLRVPASLRPASESPADAVVSLKPSYNLLIVDDSALNRKVRHGMAQSNTILCTDFPPLFVSLLLSL